jgi:hypothetical protein
MPADTGPPTGAAFALRRLSRLRRRAATVFVSVLLVAGHPAGAQAQRIVSGRVLDDRGAPVAGATVTLATATGPVGSTVTDAAGGFSLFAPGADGLEMRVARLGFFALTVQVESPPGAAALRRDVRLSPAAVAIDPVRVRTVRPVARPPALRTPGGDDQAESAGLSSTLPLPPGDLEALSGLTPGAVPLGGDRGLSIAGQAPSQTSTTLDGATYGAGTLPAEALATLAVVTSTFDPSRGQFSGGQIAATTLSGTNLLGGAARLRFSDPALQSAALARENALAIAAAGAGGALVKDRLFWYGAGDFTRRSDPVLNLDNASAGELRALGIDGRAAERLRAIADGIGYSRAPGASDMRRGRTVVNGLLRMDLAATPHHVLMLRGDARSRVADGVGEQPFALAGSGVESRDRSGGVLAQLTSFPGEGRNELRISARSSRQTRTPYLAAPSGEVLVGPADASGESTQLRFGPGALGAGTARSTLAELSDEAAFPLSAHLRMKVGVVANRETAIRSGAANALGTFRFATMDDLAAGHPTSFSRTLGNRTARAATNYFAAYAGHLWQTSDALSLIYGLRLEGREYPHRASSPGASPLFGIMPENVPAEWGLSPRLGFTYFRPNAPWSVRGGMGEFRGKLPVSPLADARGGGTPAVTRLRCVGAETPAPTWERFTEDPASIPAACVQEGADFPGNLPQSTLFSSRLAAPRTWRGQLAFNWSGATPAGFTGLSVEAGWTRGLAQPLARDLNFAVTPHFTLADEGGRAVYAPVASLDPASGSVAPDASRVDASLGTVRLVDSGGRSSVAEVGLRSYLWTRGLGLLVLSYTWTRARDEVASLAAPWQSSAPLFAGAATSRAISDLERRHLLQAEFTWPVGHWPGELGLVATVASGHPFTPGVDRDVNGDGEANDAAFVFDPAAAHDADVAAGIRSLLRGPAHVRDCLLAQLGRTASRNACHGPWSAGLDVAATFWPGQERGARRLTFSAEATNVLAGMDRLLHGSRALRGWGRAEPVDPTLLYVRGFDPDRRAFVYGVNHNFGRPVGGGSSFGQPFAVTLQARWAFGSDPVRQPLLNRVAAMRATGRTAAAVRQELARTIPNLAAQVLALSDTLRLDLRAEQVVALRAAAASFSVRLAPLVDSLAAAVDVDERSRNGPETRLARTSKALLTRRAQGLIDAARDSLRVVLTGDQWRRLPMPIQQPAAQILTPRRGIDARRSDW